MNVTGTGDLSHGHVSSLIDGQSVAPPAWEEEVTADGCMVVEQGGFVPWDNPDNIISKEVEYRFEIFHSLGFIPLLFLVGAPANILSAAVFRQGLKDRINLCLFALALADLLTITVTFLLTAERAYDTFTDRDAYFFITYFPGLTGFTFVSQFLSVVIASERCFCVASPFKAKKVLSTCTMAVIILVGSAVLLAGMLAIAGPKHTMACVYDPATNVTGNIVYVTKYYLDNKRILDIVDVFVYATAFPALFLVVIIITTAVTTAKLRSAITFRQRSTLTPATATATAPSDVKPAPSRKEVALTKMLVATSVLFIVCLTPNVAVQMTSFFVPDLGFNRRYHNLNIVLWSVISEFRVINSSVNFFVYYHMGTKFRETTKGLFRRCCCCRKSNNDSKRGRDSKVSVVSSSRSA